MSLSSPPSPESVYKAQLILEKAKFSAKKSKKTTTGSTKASSKSQKDLLPQEKENKENKENKPEQKDGLDENNEGGDINWVKNPNDTSRLLQIIEDSTRYRQAFGFKGGDMPGVTSGGQTVNQMSRNIGDQLFPCSKLPKDKLAKAISNRVRTYKTYGDYHAKLGQTGHGLVVEDRTLEITSGTSISNVWEKMRLKFPWYKRLHLLLHGSPIYDRSALINSSTPLDTHVLTPRTVNRDREHSPEWDYTALDADFAPVEEPATIHSPMPETRLSPSPMTIPPESKPSSLTPMQLQSTSVPPATPTPQNTSRKRKDILDNVRDMTAKYAEARIESECVRAENKRQRTLINTEHEFCLQQLKAEEQERQRQHIVEEHQRQRAHELQILEKQILLAQLQGGNRGNVGFVPPPPPLPTYHAEGLLPPPPPLPTYHAEGLLPPLPDN